MTASLAKREERKVQCNEWQRKERKREGKARVEEGKFELDENKDGRLS
jgi:hypothetical protein